MFILFQMIYNRIEFSFFIFMNKFLIFIIIITIISYYVPCVLYYFTPSSTAYVNKTETRKQNSKTKEKLIVVVATKLYTHYLLFSKSKINKYL